MRIVGVIPVRLKSSRLPNKALVDIEGIPMVIHVLKRAQMSHGLQAVFVATDSKEIYDVVTHYGGKAVMTSAEHTTGTDRIAEVVRNMDVDIVVNIQGDEALLNPDHIDRVVEPLKAEDDLQVAVLVTPFTKKNSPSDIKAVLDLNDYILFCSRTDLPSDVRTPVNIMWKMSFLVPFRKSFLIQYASWKPTPLEKIEFNEYLRIFEHGYKIKAVRVECAHISVDTPADLEIIRAEFKNDPFKQQYLSPFKSI